MVIGQKQKSANRIVSSKRKNDKPNNIVKFSTKQKWKLNRNIKADITHINICLNSFMSNWEIGGDEVLEEEID